MASPAYSRSGAFNDGLGQDVSRLFVAALIPALGLLVLRLILVSLPMIKNAGPIADLNLTPLLLVKAVVDTVIYFLIMRFCMTASARIRATRPHFVEVANIVLLAGCALVATLAYSAYQGLCEALAPSQMEAYNWIFLSVVLIPVGMIVLLVTRRMDFFTELMFGKMSAALSNPASPYSEPARAYSEPAPRPPAGPPPASAPPATPDPLEIESVARVAALQPTITAARDAAARLRAKGTLSAEMSESLSKMDSYFQGAQTSLDRKDWHAVKGFADWAEYEARRLGATS